MPISGPVERQLLCALRRIVGTRHVLTGTPATRPFCSGYRFGSGSVVAVARPGSLIELWRVAKACVAADAIVIMQAANTGLTGGSTPDGDDYDRLVVLISTLRITGIQLLDGGRQVLCLPGARLHELEARLRPVGREPHSVIGSSCIGASVIGGVCNNSGGALVQRGPAYTELALFARLDASGELRLINNLGIRLDGDVETVLNGLERGDYSPADVLHDANCVASDHGYCAHVRDVNAATPARFNADPQRLRDASGSAGRVIVFAVRLDTFPAEKETAVFYLGTNDPAEFTTIRRHILSRFAALPVAGEYIHREAFDIAACYGKDTFMAVRHFGTDRLPRLFWLKDRINALAMGIGLGHQFAERLLQRFSGWLPAHLSLRMMEFRNRFEHHLLLKMAGPGIAEARKYLGSILPSASGSYFECTPEEATKAFLHRFAVAGAAVRYRAVHAQRTGGIVSLDIALPRNTQDWFEKLPPALDAAILHKLYYGHFFCHVFHQDYLVKQGEDPLALEHRICTLLDARGAEYPAEHGVGHLYTAKPVLADFYRALDPLNQFNPGIGRTSKTRRWRDAETPAGAGGRKGAVKSSGREGF